MSAAALAALIRERQPCVVLTGAGVSTESGIPDFRSEAGIWADVDPYEVASIQAFRRDPAGVWGFYRARLDLLRGAEPNAAHVALAQLEHRGLVDAIVTERRRAPSASGERGRRRDAWVDRIRAVPPLSPDRVRRRGRRTTRCSSRSDLSRLWRSAQAGCRPLR